MRGTPATPPAFLRKLWTILNNDCYSEAVAWDAEGTSFEIKDRGLLSDVLAEHFRHRKFSSFQRQLNYFGFKHVGRGVYMHPAFMKKDPDGALRIARKTRPKNKKSEKNKPALDPPSCQQIMDQMMSQEDGALLEFLPNDQNVSAFMNMSEQITSAKHDAERERRLKLQQQLRQALKRDNRPEQGYDAHTSPANLHQAQLPRLFVSQPACNDDSSDPSPFVSAAGASAPPSMWELQYQAQPADYYMNKPGMGTRKLALV